MSVKRIAKRVFFVFLASCVSFFILRVLSFIGGGKYWHYVGGAGYACFYFILDKATLEWRRK
jgi:hypothetical protein